jgi:hypothetical protein
MMRTGTAQVNPPARIKKGRGVTPAYYYDDP